MLRPRPGRPRLPLRFLAPALLLLGAAAPLRAQEAPADSTLELARALAEVEPGRALRVSVRGGMPLEGAFAGVEGGALVLGGGTRIPVGSVRGVWERRRNTRRGATIGGIAGGVTGLALAGFLAILPLEGGQPETSSDVEVVLLGTLMGAGTGAGLGAGGGAASGRWVQVYPEDGRLGAPRLASRVAGSAEGAGAPAEGAAAGAAPAGRERTRRFGTVEGGLGYGRITDEGGTGGGVGGRLALLGEFRPFGEGTVLALGPEVEAQRMGSTPLLESVSPRLVCAPTCQVMGEDTTFQRTRYSALAGRLVLRLQADGERVRPYALAGLGINSWRTETESRGYASYYTHPGYTLGGGVQVRRTPGSRALGIDLRRSGVFDSEEDGEPGAYWTVSATVNAGT